MFGSEGCEERVGFVAFTSRRRAAQSVAKHAVDSVGIRRSGYGQLTRRPSGSLLNDERIVQQGEALRWNVRQIALTPCACRDGEIERFEERIRHVAADFQIDAAPAVSI